MSSSEEVNNKIINKKLKESKIDILDSKEKLKSKIKRVK